jgi:hypothetical protein
MNNKLCDYTTLISIFEYIIYNVTAKNHERYKVFKIVTMKIIVFRDMKPCCLEILFI